MTLKSGWPVLTALLVGAVALQAAVYATMAHFIDDAATRGQFGDAFGVTNSLFSGLALAALVYTIMLQRQQIASQETDTATIRTDTATTLAHQQQANNLHALTLLLSLYDARLARLPMTPIEGPRGAASLISRDRLLEQRAELEALIGKVHADVIANLGSR